MATGWLSWTGLMLALAAAPSDDVVYLNQRGFQIPVRIQPEKQNQVSEQILYLSRDQGKTWEIYSRAKPSSKAFEFYAAGDGLLYFSVAVTDLKGVQDPKDLYQAPVGQKICIDTVKPVVHLTKAERQGPDVQVSWEVREEHPEWTSFRLEWKSAEGSSTAWTPLPVQPTEKGSHAFKCSVPGDIQVRVFLKDKADNEAMEEKPIRGSGPVPDSGIARTRGEDLPPPPTGLVPPPLPAPTATNPPGLVSNIPAPSIGPGSSTGTGSAPVMNPPGLPGLPESPTPVPPPVSAPVPMSITRPVSENPAPAAPVSVSSGASPAANTAPMPRGTLPPLQITNKRQVKLGFDVSRFGPSGLGSVEIYQTADDGATWEKMPGDSALTLPTTGDSANNGMVKGFITVNIAKEGVPFGFYLVVKSRAGLGKPAPRSGDVPHVRLECDSTQPQADLYAPQPDPSRPASLVLSWKAEDRNLAPNPVTIEWSANAGGPWEAIGEPQHANSGRYVWAVPGNVPPKVFLKLSVKDTAGNIAVAQTPGPVLIDLTVPEVAGVQVLDK